MKRIVVKSNKLQYSVYPYYLISINLFYLNSDNTYLPRKGITFIRVWCVEFLVNNNTTNKNMIEIFNGCS